jgi:hypothetical protein
MVLLFHGIVSRDAVQRLEPQLQRSRPSVRNPHHHIPEDWFLDGNKFTCPRKRLLG